MLIVGFPWYSRFIPTCVGNMAMIFLPLRAVPVHPHVCGEHRVDLRNGVCDDGSSPRVWGTCVIVPGEFALRRFIPTCVGNMSRARIPPRCMAVHPHVCGEHS